MALYGQKLVQELIKHIFRGCLAENDTLGMRVLEYVSWPQSAGCGSQGKAMVMDDLTVPAPECFLISPFPPKSLTSLLPLSTLVSVRRRWTEEPCSPISLVDKFNILRKLVERRTQFLQTSPAVSETK